MVLTNERDWTFDIELRGISIHMTVKGMQAWRPRDSTRNEKQETGAQNPGKQYLKVKRRKRNQKKKIRKSGQRCMKDRSKEARGGKRQEGEW